MFIGKPLIIGTSGDFCRIFTITASLIVCLTGTRKKVPKKHYQKVEELWKKAVKLRAGMKSELGGIGSQLHAHHIMGKSNYALRFYLDNGICLTGGEHMNGCHNDDARVAKMWQDRCLKRRGVTYNHLKKIGNSCGGTNLFEVEEYLKKKIKEYGG